MYTEEEEKEKKRGGSHDTTSSCRHHCIWQILDTSVTSGSDEAPRIIHPLYMQIGIASPTSCFRLHTAAGQSLVSHRRKRDAHLSAHEHS